MYLLPKIRDYKSYESKNVIMASRLVSNKQIPLDLITVQIWWSMELCMWRSQPLTLFKAGRIASICHIAQICKIGNFISTVFAKTYVKCFDRNL